jgi:hypothetical protein
VCSKAGYGRGSCRAPRSSSFPNTHSAYRSIRNQTLICDLGWEGSSFLLAHTVAPIPSGESWVPILGCSFLSTQRTECWLRGGLGQHQAPRKSPGSPPRSCIQTRPPSSTRLLVFSLIVVPSGYLVLRSQWFAITYSPQPGHSRRIVIRSYLELVTGSLRLFYPLGAPDPLSGESTLESSTLPRKWFPLARRKTNSPAAVNPLSLPFLRV